MSGIAELKLGYPSTYASEWEDYKEQFEDTMKQTLHYHQTLLRLEEKDWDVDADGYEVDSSGGQWFKFIAIKDFDSHDEFLDELKELMWKTNCGTTQWGEYPSEPDLDDD